MQIDKSPPYLCLTEAEHLIFLNLFGDKGLKVNFNKQDYVGGVVLDLETFL